MNTSTHIDGFQSIMIWDSGRWFEKICISGNALICFEISPKFDGVPNTDFLIITTSIFLRIPFAYHSIFSGAECFGSRNQNLDSGIVAELLF